MDIKNSKLNYKDLIPQFIQTLLSHQRAVRFTKKHKLWEGFWKYGWVSKLLLLVGLIIGLKFFGIFFQWFNKFREADTAHMMTVVSGMFTDFFTEGYGELFNGGTKYMMLVMLEVIIFHMCRRTLELLHGKYEAELGFKDFVNAQVRMLKVGLHSWILEIIFATIISFILGILGFKFLKDGFIFAAQCYFLGWAVVDNYNEQFNLTINESFKYTFQYAGVALAVGAVLYILMLIPIVGPIIGPIVAAVTATMVMYELSDLHLPTQPELTDEQLGDTV